VISFIFKVKKGWPDREPCKGEVFCFIEVFKHACILNHIEVKLSCRRKRKKSFPPHICLINRKKPQPATNKPNTAEGNPPQRPATHGYRQEELTSQYFLSPWFSSKNSTKHSGFLPCLGNLPELLSSTGNCQSYLGCIPFCCLPVSSLLTFAQPTKAAAVRDSFTTTVLQCCLLKTCKNLPRN